MFKQGIKLWFLISLLVPCYASYPILATVDHDHIILSNDVFLDVRANIEKLHKTYQNDLELREKELRKLEEYLRDNEGKLAPDVFLEHRRAFDVKVEETQKIVAERRKKLDKYFNKVRIRIIDTAMDIIKDLCSEQSIIMVIPKSQIIYAIESIDITAIVLERLNKQLSTAVIPVFSE